MKKYITLLLCLAVVATGNAQKKDTTVLSVYNNNQRFMLYSMPFGKDKPDKNFTAEMVVALDTILTLQASTTRDSSGKYPKRWVTTRRCGKLPTNVKDKVALLLLNTDCDISTQVLNAQNAGALAVIIVHTTNRTDSVILPKLTGRDRYVDEDKVKIPCFTIRNEIGAKIIPLLPSLVGIRRPDSVGVVQALTQVVPTDSLRGKQAAQSLNADKANVDKSSADKQADANAEVQKQAYTASLADIGWDIAPNPVSNDMTIRYNFKEANTLFIDVFNEIGQLVTNYQLPDTQTGKLDINVTAWQDGVYNVRISSGSFRQNKRLIVTH